MCDEASQVCVKGATASTATATAGTGTGSGTSTASTASGQGGDATGGGGQGGQGPLATPLEVTQTVNSYTFEVAGRFRLEADDASTYHLTKWFDLATDPALDLGEMSDAAYTDVVYEPPQLQDPSGVWWTLYDASLVSTSLRDQTPVRAALTVVADHPIEGGIRSTTVFTVYASGRVGVAVSLANESGPTKNFNDCEIHYVTLNDQVSWMQGDQPSGLASAFQRTDGPTPRPTLLAIHFGPEQEIEHDAGWNTYWNHDALTIAAGSSIRWDGELQFGPGGQDMQALSDRVDDVYLPGLSAVPPATVLGYSDSEGAYGISSAGQPAEFVLDGARDRHDPAFVVTDWGSPTFTIRRGGVIVATDAAPIGTDVLARYDATLGELVFTYVGTIPGGAPEAERTFRVE